MSWLPQPGGSILRANTEITNHNLQDRNHRNMELVVLAAGLNVKQHKELDPKSKADPDVDGSSFHRLTLTLSWLTSSVEETNFFADWLPMDGCWSSLHAITAVVASLLVVLPSQESWQSWAAKGQPVENIGSQSQARTAATDMPLAVEGNPLQRISQDLTRSKWLKSSAIFAKAAKIHAHCHLDPWLKGEKTSHQLGFGCCDG